MVSVGQAGNSPQQYKVQDKDTWFGIAKKFNLSIHELAKANGCEFKNGAIYNSSGQKVDLKAGVSILNIGSAGSTTSTTTNVSGQTPQTQTAQQKTTTHTVKSGDTLLEIAKAKGVTIRQLAAANGWSAEIALSKTLALGEEIKIPPSVITNIKTLKNMDGVEKSTGLSENYLKMIAKYEGDANGDPHLKAYKDIDTWSIGFGEAGVKPDTTWTKEQSYTNLAKKLLQTKEDIRLELGDEIWNKTPKALQEGIIDLVYNKGFGAFDIEKFKSSINKNDYTGAMQTLIYTRAIGDDQEYNGLYTRSLAQLVHVYKGLGANTKAEVKAVIDDLYNKCVGRGININDINFWEAPIAAPKVPAMGLEKEEPKAETPTAPEMEAIEKGDATKAILAIKESNADKAERLEQTKTAFAEIAKKYGISQTAIDKFNAIAEDEYDSILYVNAEKMTIMTDILDAKDGKALRKAIEEATGFWDSDEAKTFAKEVLPNKITAETAADFVKAYEDNGEFIDAMKNLGNFEVMKHTLEQIITNKEKQGELLALFDQYQKENNYNGIERIFDTVVPRDNAHIKKTLEKTLSKDDDLNSVLYKYQIQNINSKNIKEILQDGRIIEGICEAENDREICKAEIIRLFNALDNRYQIDETKKEEFLAVVDKEFRERSTMTPSTWWIGTSKISAAFKSLIPNISEKTVDGVVFKELGFEYGLENYENMNKLSFDGVPIKNGHVFAPTAEGELSGKRIVVNAGHGGINPKAKTEHDPGAENNNYATDEWVMNLYMAKKLIPELQAKGAEVVITFGKVTDERIKYKSFGGDMMLSLHCDSYPLNKRITGPTILANKKDTGDKKLATKILESFTTQKGVIESEDLRRADKMHNLSYQYNDTEEAQQIQIKIDDTVSKQILRRDDNNNLKAPSILIEYCNIQNNNEIENIVFGNFGNDIIKALVDGTINYWK